MIGDFPAALDRPHGGVEAVTRNLAFGLAEAGVELTMVRFGNANPPEPTGALPFDVIDLARHRPGNFGNWLLTPRDVEKIVAERKPDVVHLQGTSELYRGSNPPSVLTVHGVPYKDATHGGGLLRRFIQPLILRATFEESIRNHAHVISINPMVQDELGARPHLRFFDIPNPVEDHFFEIERVPTAGHLLYVGVLHPRKNIEGLIEAAADAKSQGADLTLRLAGPFLDGYETAIRDCIDRTGMQDSVELLGSLTRAEVGDELSRCSALALASFQETAPMAIAEAMAAGVPVISTLAGGIGSMLDHDRTGMTSPVGDMKTFARNITAVLTDDAKRDAIGHTARAAAEDNYRLARIVERTCDVYRAAIGGD